MKITSISVFSLIFTLLGVSADDLKCYECNSIYDESCGSSNNSNINQVECSSDKCIISKYQCGYEIAPDCQTEFDNQRNNLDPFYNRCATEGGSHPLRLRCRLCCEGENYDRYKNETLIAEVRNCADPNAELGCFNMSGSATYVCNDTTLCNDHIDCYSSASKNFTFWHSICYDMIFIMLIMLKIY